MLHHCTSNDPTPNTDSNGSPYISYLGRHNGSLKVLRPNSGRPITDGHEVLVLGGIALDAVDGPVVLARPHVKDADAVVLLPVAKVHLYTCIHTYIHTYIHIYIYIYIPRRD